MLLPLSSNGLTRLGPKFPRSLINIFVRFCSVKCKHTHMATFFKVHIFFHFLTNYVDQSMPASDVIIWLNIKLPLAKNKEGRVLYWIIAILYFQSHCL